jgi:uncharacterized membrane protein HdeD (DUF308 family)
MYHSGYISRPSLNWTSYGTNGELPGHRSCTLFPANFIKSFEQIVALRKRSLMATTIPIASGRHGSTLSTLWGVLLVILGLVAIGTPFLAAVAVSVVVAWLIVLAGVVHIVLAFHAHGAGSISWKLLVGLAYLVFGGYMLVHPLLGVASLTLLLAVLFVVEGALNIVLYFKMRPLHGSGWVLVDGLITLLLGAMIYVQWPFSAAWAIGILVGVSMMISGFTRIALSWAVRRATVSPVVTKLAA